MVIGSLADSRLVCQTEFNNFPWNIISLFFCSLIQSRCSSGFAEDFAASSPSADNVDGRSAQTTPPRNIPVIVPISGSSSRRGSLLPSQQSCEVDDEAIENSNSLMTELIQVQQLSVSWNMITGKFPLFISAKIPIYQELHKIIRICLTTLDFFVKDRI